MYDVWFYKHFSLNFDNRVELYFSGYTSSLLGVNLVWSKPKHAFTGNGKKLCTFK